MGGNGDQDAAAGLQLRGDGDERLAVALDMLEHVEEGDEIVGARLDPAQLRERRVEHRPAEAAAGDGPRGGIDLDRVDRAEAAEHVEVWAGPAADLEDARARRRADSA